MATAIVSHHVCSAVSPAVEPAKSHASVYNIVTERILAELEKGQVPWRTLPPAGKKLGRPSRSIDGPTVAVLRSQGASWRAIAKRLGVGVGTLYRAVPALSRRS